MRVLFLTYPHSGLFRGGMEIQIAKTAEALTELGVEVIPYSPWRDEIEAVDLCHVFSVDGSMAFHVERARERGTPVVISPVFNSFAESATRVQLKAKVSQWVPGMRGGLATSRRMLNTAARIVALNEGERALLIKALGCKPELCVVIPNGINRAFIDADPELVRERYGVSDYILQVGSVIPRKNQLALLRATTHLPHSVLIVGEGNDVAYMERCREAAGGNAIFIGALDYADPLLASLFAGAKLFVLPSFSEVMPLSLYEAAVAGCRLIASRNFPIAEEIRSCVPTFDPANESELTMLIQSEMKLPRNPRLAEAARAMPSWQDVGRQLLRVYNMALGACNGSGRCQ